MDGQFQSVVEQIKDKDEAASGDTAFDGFFTRQFSLIQDALSAAIVILSSGAVVP